MNPPKDALLAGHPVIAVPVTLVTLAAFCAGFQDSGWWVFGVVMLWPCHAVARASAKRTEYLQWKRAWDGMDAEPAPRTPPQPGRPARWRPWLGGLMLAGIALYCLTQAGSDPLYAMAAIWLVLAVPVAGAVAWIARRVKGGAVSGKAASVTVCIGQPLMPVPSLKHAYRALPAHCRVVLGL